MHILIKVVKKSRPDGYFSRLQKMLEALQLLLSNYLQLTEVNQFQLFQMCFPLGGKMHFYLAK